jgi:hypothetical protein
MTRNLLFAAMFLGLSGVASGQPTNQSVIGPPGVSTYNSPYPLVPTCAVLNSNGLPVVRWEGEKLPDGSISCPAHTEPPLK